MEKTSTKEMERKKKYAEARRHANALKEGVMEYGFTQTGGT